MPLKIGWRIQTHLNVCADQSMMGTGCYAAISQAFFPLYFVAKCENTRNHELLELFSLVVPLMLCLESAAPDQDLYMLTISIIWSPRKIGCSTDVRHWRKTVIFSCRWEMHMLPHSLVITETIGRDKNRNYWQLDFFMLALSYSGALQDPINMQAKGNPTQVLS